MAEPPERDRELAAALAGDAQRLAVAFDRVRVLSAGEFGDGLLRAIEWPESQAYRG
jgi:hypothetical protein